MNLLVLLASFLAQAGDKPGEPQPPPIVHAPDAPVLSPEKAMESLHVADGLTVELVAAEPMIEDPVCMAFAPDGRLWVVEMRGFMPNVDGQGEEEPIGRVVVLQDSNADGLFDRSTTFMDDIVLPRGVAPLLDGALIIAPPNLLYARDTDGDGRADDISTVLEGFGGIESPEHAGNGLVRGIDNWHHLSQHNVDIRFRNSTIETRPIRVRGQWGIGQDASGRLYTTPNSIPLLVDLLPPHYGARNRTMKGSVGAGRRVDTSIAVHPARVNPGVNRGYRDGVLRSDGTLAHFEAACGTSIYVGDDLPDMTGDAIICEPAGNLVKRKSFAEGRHDRAIDPLGTTELLASTDERFRPVWSVSGPDGAIYIADMYRGILQHRLFVTTFLRKQILERGLDRPLGMGRIWRITNAHHQRQPIADLTRLTGKELVDHLSHPDGAVRLLAQQVLVERGASEEASAVRSLLGSDIWTTRLHALWTLEGIGDLPRDVAIVALHDEHPEVRAAAARLLEQWMDDAIVLEAVASRRNEPVVSVRRQIVASLGEADGEPAMALLADLARRWGSDAVVREAVVSGLAGSETQFIDTLTNHPDFDIDSPGLGSLVELLIQTAPLAEESNTVVLDAQARAQFDRGAAVYAVCAACHQADGMGIDTQYPPLAGSPIVTGDPEMLAKVLLHGIAGPIAIDGRTFNEVMPAAPVRGIDDLAAVMTFVRNAFGNAAPPVDGEFVRAVRAANRDRTRPWTIGELLGDSNGH
jgi:mono/diheme cytochrome c family protein